MSDYKPSNLHKADVIAQLFGISVRRVQQLTQEGIIQTVRDPNVNYTKLCEISFR